jgi:hypothetical protein
MPITLPDNLKPLSPYRNGIDYVDLPFAYLRMGWNNGNPHASKADGVKYYGGFERGMEDITPDLEAMNLTDVPSYFSQPIEFINDEGKAYLARASRYLYAAPIMAKDDWWEEKDTRTREMKKRHRLDFLVYLASIQKDVLIPWGPAVISKQGYAATAIIRAFKGWQKDTADIRRVAAPRIDASCFFACVGTFGPDRIQDKAGESIYVPCQFNHPEKWTEEQLERLFVGESVAAIIIDLQGQAEEWMNDTHANRLGQNKKEDGTQESVRFGSLAPENFAPGEVPSDIPPF